VLARRRLARAAVAGLVVDLGAQAEPGDVRVPLARALGDPSLDLVYWVPTAGRYVDRGGTPRELPAPGEGRAATVVERGGLPIAAILHDPALSENAELVRSVASAAALAIENERLHADLQARLAELRASRTRLVEAGDRERRRIERNLHDGAQQRLVSVAMTLGLAHARARRQPDEVAALLEEARSALALAMDELRELSQGIHPGVLTERGLDAAVDELAGSAPLPVTVDGTVGRRLPEGVEGAAYFLVSESLANAAKHSHASSVRLAVALLGDRVVLRVEDDGIGGADPARGSGLRGLVDRIEALGGTMSVSSPPGRGTVLQAELPCA
jgi:signal transduction histidine kinase